MTTAPLAKQYATLTPAERLPLIMAANARGDDVEYQRLVNSAPRECYRIPHTSGLAMAFREVGEQHHMELLTLAERYLQCLSLANAEDDEHSARILDCALMFGYMHKVNVAGWRTFCAGLHIDAEPFQRLLPGRDLLTTAEELAEHTAFTTEGALRFIQETDSTAAAILTAEGVAGGLQAIYQARCEWWG